MKLINEKITDYIQNNQTFLLMTHQKPDGDAIGSVIALGRGLKQIGKQIDYFMQDPIEQNLSFFDEIKYFNKTENQSYDAVIVVDCSTWTHICKPAKLPEYKAVINIDHHITNEGYGDFNHVENVAAASELIYRLLKQMNMPLDEEMADALYTGISTDTGSFQFSNVTSATHQILAELYQYPYRYADIARRVHHEKSLMQMKMYGAAIENTTLINDATIAWTVLDYKTIHQYGGDINISDDIANIGINIKGVSIGVTLKEVEKDIYRVSLRASSECDFDVSSIAKCHDGGGHNKASGFTFQSNLEALKQEITSKFNEVKDGRNQ